MSAALSLGLDDTADMAGVHAAAFPKADTWSADQFRDLMTQPSCKAFGIKGDGGLEAILLVQFVVGECEILTIATEPSRRQRGLARALIAFADRDLSPDGVNTWLLDVAEDNLGAISFYEKLGFVIDGRRPRYYQRANAKRVDAVLMSRQAAGQTSN